MTRQQLINNIANYNLKQVIKGLKGFPAERSVLKQRKNKTQVYVANKLQYKYEEYVQEAKELDTTFKSILNKL
jgi:hypothetical protein